jgi:predicted AlkP superfamily pyrophosphatase or phosphodiesterase
LAALTAASRLARLVLVAFAASCASAPPSARSPAADRPQTAPGASVRRTVTGGVNDPSQQSAPYLVLLSFDGFRADYLDRTDLPNIRRLVTRGARSRGLTPVFPSLTFPNHYSLVTGLYPERHGIVANSFYDPARQETYSLRDAKAVSDGTWYRGEPIWVTAETQGMVAGCFFWPGSEAAIQGVSPTFATKYDGAVPNTIRVDTVLEWLRLPDDRRPHVVTLYLSDIDSASHQHELDSAAIGTALQTVDATLGRLLDGLDALPIRDRVYVMLTSDHGMANTSVAKTMAFEDAADMTGVRVAEAGPVANLHVTAGAARAREVRDALNAKLQHGRAYLRHDVPQRFHYRADPRIGDVVVIMEEGFMIDSAERIAKRTRREPYGMHGWDSALPSMRGVFVVAGPGIPAGVTIPEVSNVDVYPFMAELLGLRSARDIDGRPGRIRIRTGDYFGTASASTWRPSL